MTYRELAARYGFELCEMCDLNAHEQGHLQGDRIHWRERRVTHSGLRRFLLLLAGPYLVRNGFGSPNREAEWIWMRNVWAYNQALDLGYRLPRRLSEVDRARVRYLLEGKARSAAKDWARARMI